MKKLSVLLISVFAWLTVFVACGPSKKEQAATERAIADSISRVFAERAKATADAEQARAKAIADSIEKVAAERAKPFLQIGKLEVMKKNFKNPMTWSEAVSACDRLGNGWRLPSNDELNFLYNNRKKIGGLSDYGYWSTYEEDNDGAWEAFPNGGDRESNGGSSYFYKYGHVRAVRNFHKSNKNENNNYFTGEYEVQTERAYFYSEPNEDAKLKAYVVTGEIIGIKRITNNYGYTDFINSGGKKTSGWLKMYELSFDE